MKKLDARKSLILATVISLILIAILLNNANYYNGNIKALIPFIVIAVIIAAIGLSAIFIILRASHMEVKIATKILECRKSNEDINVSDLANEYSTKNFDVIFKEIHLDNESKCEVTIKAKRLFKYEYKFTA